MSQKNNKTDRPKFFDNRKDVSFLNREIRLKEILKYKNSGKLLDVGCALGFFLKFAEKYFETYGIDISPSAVERAKKIATHSGFFVGDAQTKYPFRSNFFDIVVSFDVIEHLSKPEYSLAEAHRVLKPEGYLFLQTPTDRSRGIIPDDTHISLFAKSALLNLLENIGFRIILFEKRRSNLYIVRVFKKLFKSNQTLDSYDLISKTGKMQLFIIKRIKLLIYNFDKYISKFTPAPEMFIIAQKCNAPH
jgi:SAM-dependent methyltransferase